jgi:hypothetical protein
MPSAVTVTTRRLMIAGGLTVVLLAGLGAVVTDRHQAAGSEEQSIVQVSAGRRQHAVPADPVTETPEPAVIRRVRQLPGGGTRVFGRQRFLVAYYGTAGTGALGVLGETAPDEMQRRLRRAAQPFKRDGERIQSVYELIVTVADPHAGPDGDFSHDIAASHVRDYVEAAHRNNALVVLDLQPGRSDFLTIAKRWGWALRDPWVGLALDPEWRMGPRQVPGRVIGGVGAAEVNRVSRWLARLVRREHLPEKPFLLHQFRTTMIRDIAQVVVRPGLAMVQHADGFGTQGQKLATYHAVARPEQFAMGFKLFYDEDVHRFSPAELRRVRPVVRFVSYQ